MHETARPLFELRPLWSDVFWVAYWAWILFETWVFARDRRSARGLKSDRGSRAAILGSVAAGVALAFTAPYFAPGARIGAASAAVFGGAMVLMWAGLAFRLWAILTLGRFFRTAVLVQDEHRLVTAGPYRLLRHPSYSGSLLTVTGIGLAMGNWVSLAAAPLCLGAAYAWRIHTEEQALRARFGAAFEAQRRRTWALVPYVW